MNEKKYTLWQRIISPKPKLFIRLQLIGVAVSALGLKLSAVPGFPERYVTILMTAGITMIAVAQFPVKQFIDGIPEEEKENAGDR